MKGNNPESFNIIGEKKGRLTVVDFIPGNNSLGYRAQVICLCECGNTTVIHRDAFRNANTKSCGCKRRENGYLKSKPVIGVKKGRLVAIEEILGSSIESNKLKCQCECGNVTVVIKDNFLREHVKSCGCLKLEGDFQVYSVIKRYNHPVLGKYEKSLYSRYRTMISRCYDSKAKGYDRYGAVGIKVHDIWLNGNGKVSGFYCFAEWAINNDYDSKLSLDRNNNEGEYSPENCRWVTYKDQARNRANNKFITINGKTKTIYEWMEFYCIAKNTYYHRISKGWTREKALMTPINKSMSDNAKSKK